MTTDAIHISPPIIGYQFVDAIGQNIAGDDEDPSGQPSFVIHTIEAAQDVLRKAWPKRYLLEPIFEGDVEEPTIQER